MPKLFLPVQFCLLALFICPNVFAGNPDAGKAKSQLCAACHGADGNSPNPAWPNLAGQNEEYLIKQLMDFKSGKRKNAQMSPMASPLTSQDVDDLAAYFAAQTHKKSVAKSGDIEMGETLYRAGNLKTGVAACMACHGPTGAGNPAAKYPALAGQHADYTVLQLKAFKDGSRNNDANSIMRVIAGKMTDAEIDAVAGYIQGLYK